MDLEINSKILKKVDQISDKEIKGFLKEVLLLEFGHQEERMWGFREEYEKIINKHIPESI